MAMNTSKCNHLPPLPFKGLSGNYCMTVDLTDSRFDVCTVQCLTMLELA